MTAGANRVLIKSVKVGKKCAFFNVLSFFAYFHFFSSLLGSFSLLCWHDISLVASFHRGCTGHWINHWDTTGLETEELLQQSIKTQAKEAFLLNFKYAQTFSANQNHFDLIWLYKMSFNWNKYFSYIVYLKEKWLCFCPPLVQCISRYELWPPF